MLVRDYMTAHPVTVTPQTSVLTARRLMTMHRIRHLPVCDGDRLVGILSDRDLRVGDAAIAQSLSSLQSDLLSGRYRPVGTLMSAPVQVVRPDEPLLDAARAMRHWTIGALPVLDGDRVAGIITTTDCLDALLEHLTAEERAAKLEVAPRGLEPVPAEERAAKLEVAP